LDIRSKLFVKILPFLQLGDTSLGIELTGKEYRFVLLRCGLKTYTVLETGQVPLSNFDATQLPQSDYTQLILPHERMMLKEVAVPLLPDSEIEAFLNEEANKIFPFRQSSQESLIRWKKLRENSENKILAVLLLRPEQSEEAVRRFPGRPLQLLHWLFGMGTLLPANAEGSLQRYSSTHLATLKGKSYGNLEFDFRASNNSSVSSLSIEQESDLTKDLDQVFWPAAAAALNAFRPFNSMDLGTDEQRLQTSEAFYQQLTKKAVICSGLLILILAGMLYGIQFGLLSYHFHLEKKLLAVLPQAQELNSLKVQLTGLQNRKRTLSTSANQSTTLALHLARLSKVIPNQIWLTNVAFSVRDEAKAQVVINALAPDPAYLSELLSGLEKLKEIENSQLREMRWISAKDILRKWKVKQSKSIQLTVEYDVRNIVEVD